MPILTAVRRVLAIVASLATLALAATGCGETGEASATAAPAPADLAADALGALAERGSAHFVVDASFRDPVEEDTSPLVVHAEGGASVAGLSAEGSVDYGFGPVEGKLLVGAREVLVYAKAFDEWYGTRGTGFALVGRFATLGPDQPVWLLAVLATEDGLRRYSDDVVEARVRPGPDIDGVETWQLEGALDAEGIARLLDRPAEDLEALELVASASRFVLVAGRDDRLPRRIELHIDLTPEVAAKIDDWDAFELPGGGVQDTEIAIALSGFGGPVAYEPPASIKPLDELFARLFAGFE